MDQCSQSISTGDEFQVLLLQLKILSNHLLAWYDVAGVAVVLVEYLLLVYLVETLSDLIFFLARPVNQTGLFLGCLWVGQASPGCLLSRGFSKTGSMITGWHETIWSE